MAELATAQASFYSTQANLNQRLQESDKRQKEIVKIQTNLNKRLEESDKRQGEIVEIIKLLTNK